MREGAWLIATVALFLLSLLLRQSLLFTVSLALLMAAGLARVWNRYCFARLEYRREITPQRAFIGEELELTTEVVNRKLLPLAWLEVEDEFPDELVLKSNATSPSHRARRYYLTNLLALRWYERVRRRHRLQCTARGHFLLGPVHMRSGDIFGLAMNEKEWEAPDYVLVYPKVVPIAALGLPSVHPFGDMRIRQQLFEDPLRTVGVRPYAYGDSMRRVHWKATARTQELQVKLYEATTTLRLIVFLNMNTFGPHWWWHAQDPATLELAITVAASVANWGIEQGYQVGLYANGGARRSDEKIKVPPGRDPSQLVLMLEVLAKVMPFATAPFEDLLRMESRSLPWGSTLVVVTAIVTEEMAGILESMRDAGHKVTLLLVGEGSSADPFSVQGRDVEGSHDLSRDYGRTLNQIPPPWKAEGDTPRKDAAPQEVSQLSRSNDSNRYYEHGTVDGGKAAPTERDLWGPPTPHDQARPEPSVAVSGEGISQPSSSNDLSRYCRDERLAGNDGDQAGVPWLKGIQIHRVKVSWREIRDLQLD
ncbi:MAG: DUF58 domain-containing protein [Chloroflexi bacterium]|nr:DUF58 domain-containing protein [Chloroflexota bacterium]